jgi:ABC-type multidrug transport system fused ATPase/permease subunit
VAVAAVILLWVMSGRVLEGSLSVPEFIVFFMYVFVFVKPLSGAAGVYGATLRTWGSAVRIIESLAEPAEPDTGSEVEAFKTAVKFADVAFAYRGRPGVFQHLSLQFKRGQTTAILGANGAGKSTILRLLLRFVEPKSGQITIDGVPYTSLSSKSLRKLFGIVPQEMTLLSGSIYENIALGARRADMESVVRAARQAQADAFINSLPDGYETVVGEGGVLLSGGQRQRIALARALLGDAPILVLDEATSMLDKDAEADFFEDFRGAFANLTVIVISHSLADLTFAHQVVRIEGGGAVVVDSSVG